MSLREEYKSSLKSMDTEEHIDLYFYRPLGFAWAKLFAKMGVSPNAVTIASIFLGVAGGVLLYFGQPGLAWLNYVGIFLIIWANTYDSADGQLARMTKQYSRLGRILDGLSGDRRDGCAVFRCCWLVGSFILFCFLFLHRKTRKEQILVRGFRVLFQHRKTLKILILVRGFRVLF